MLIEQEQEAPNNFVVFRVKMLPVNVHVLLFSKILNQTTVNVLVNFKTKNKHKKK